jgi:hypothetical protein
MSGMRREAVKVVRPDLFVSLLSLKVLDLGEGGKRLRLRLRPGGCRIAGYCGIPVCLGRIFGL